MRTYNQPLEPIATLRLFFSLGEKKGKEMMSTKANIATEKFLGGYN
jgi:hypothetical protein